VKTRKVKTRKTETGNTKTRRRSDGFSVD